ncbi:L-histidine N(alpha)-methyltransferase [Arenibacter sp. GZD96]|uniref:L-histidine N(alpha)-methyltransferase n=1 Tax=Aurantibrevibacter litoralis TaxID=3106030 RepID=UPI002B003118|nr:L-histidine N(alpha)-methyltransferase [Arenibacter sp. GZD-96]MEA1787113.1 L-histidine N(alpha)-methyltransferase [Arenibacter sp. GZD-96]
MQQFLEHVKEGLHKSPKKLSSRYFYDAKGDALFQQIMQLDEYYLPRSEMQIITSKSVQLAQDISAKHKKIQIVELGAGDGTKTKHLLRQVKPYFETLEYVALDISSNVLNINKEEIKAVASDINITSIAGNYFDTYKKLPPSENSRLVLFLGANIGNYPTPEAICFFKFIKAKLKANDALLVAFDLVKHPRKILAAYDDSQGVTKQFNMNLLARMNRELGANFDLEAFDHFPFYNPMTGITSSQIISLKKQTIEFKDGFSVVFDAYEAIHTEVSKKFFWTDIEEIAQASNMQILQTYFDVKKEYAFVLFQPNV